MKVFWLSACAVALVLSRCEDEAKLVGRIRGRINIFKRHVGVNENNGSDVRVAEAFGLAANRTQTSRKPRWYPCSCYPSYPISRPTAHHARQNVMSQNDRKSQFLQSFSGRSRNPYSLATILPITEST